MVYGERLDQFDKREIRQLLRDIHTAHTALRKTKADYIKKQLKAKSKKETEDLSVFEPLKDYNSTTDIQDAYGYNVITYNQYLRLLELWENRESFYKDRNKYSDRITVLFDEAISNCGLAYIQELEQLGKERNCNLFES